MLGLTNPPADVLQGIAALTQACRNWVPTELPSRPPVPLPPQMIPPQPAEICSTLLQPNSGLDPHTIVVIVGFFGCLVALIYAARKIVDFCLFIALMFRQSRREAPGAFLQYPPRDG
jgi:hypothetical protein